MTLTSKDLKWIGVDLDMTLAHNTGYPDFALLSPMEGARDAMIEIKNRGFKGIVFTARAYGDYKTIEDWLNKYDIPFSRIICGKPLLRWMVDDRAIGFNGDWQDALDKII